ncbi:nicotinate-nucleotide adenylyltransferase [Methylotenera versatilis]|uniref:nicotinate-nucleotide adenylyltransferase n=1 Tax=Methylotenera versatilis TaxID=1055487 RepID=UPI000646E22E|nr:nicotinate-nucleotide adenylyltransferase [Methylotenera versatilis]
MQLIGVLGGTFNPIHFGHLRLAQELTDALNLKEVRFIPAANPPHKDAPSVSAFHRAEMVKLAIADNPSFKLDERELQREGASYTIDTLISLRSKIGPEVALCLIMGSDAFTRLNTWHRWQEILDYCHIILVQRPPITVTNQPPLANELTLLLQNHYTENVSDLSDQNAGFIHMQTITALSISSTAIRSAFKLKQIPRYLMPQTVIDYIAINQLYD